jgi:hypothetical protein
MGLSSKERPQIQEFADREQHRLEPREPGSRHCLRESGGRFARRQRRPTATEETSEVAVLIEVAAENS